MQYIQYVLGYFTHVIYYCYASFEVYHSNNKRKKYTNQETFNK